MPDLDALSLAYMHDELVKEAVGAALLRGAGTLGSKLVGALRGRALTTGAGAGAGSLAGAGVGAVGGAIEGAQDDGGLAGALEGALNRGKQGLMAGAALGAGAGLSGRLAGSRAGKLITEGSNPLALAGRFGQRQVHGLTGIVPGGAKIGTKEYGQAAAKLRLQGRSAPHSVDTARAALQSARSSGASAKEISKLEKAVSRAGAEAKTSREALEMGMTSLPGMVNAVRQHGVKSLWTHGVKPQATQQGLMGKAFLALPAATSISELMTSQEEDPEGRGRAERFGKALMGGATYAAAPFLPIVAGEALSSGVGGASGLAGKGLDKLIGAVASRREKDEDFIGDSTGSPHPTDIDSQGGIPVERVMSNAARGQPPENLLL